MLETERILRPQQLIGPDKRRSSPRIHAPARMIIRTGGRTYAAELRDISASGARIRIRKRATLGASVLLSLPNMPPVKAFVKWAVEDELGLAFETPLPIPIIADWLNDRVNVPG